MCDLVVIWEGCGKLGTLLLAEGSEVWIADRVAGLVEVVVALGVADAVDCCFAHDFDCLGYRYIDCRFEVCRCWKSCGVNNGGVRMVGQIVIRAKC